MQRHRSFLQAIRTIHKPKSLIRHEIRIRSKNNKEKEANKGATVYGRKEQKKTFIRSEKEHSINHDRNRENDIQGETYIQCEREKEERGTETERTNMKPRDRYR